MNTLRILIVDDNTDIAELLAEMLESIGHIVCGIESTESGAVNAAARCKPTLMIVDVKLGQGSGIRAMERILGAGPMPHVFISGDILPMGKETLRKPFREAELVQAMDRALSAMGVAGRVPAPSGDAAHGPLQRLTRGNAGSAV